jgi:hypothetical protein
MWTRLLVAMLRRSLLTPLVLFGGALTLLPPSSTFGQELRAAGCRSLSLGITPQHTNSAR